MGLFDWFSNRKLIEGDVVDLRERYRVDERSAYDGVPTVYYDVLNHENKEKVGNFLNSVKEEGEKLYNKVATEENKEKAADLFNSVKDGIEDTFKKEEAPQEEKPEDEESGE